MEVASVETGETFGDHVGLSKQVSLYKVKDNEGNPSFFLCVSNTTVSLIFGTEDSNSSFSFPSGVVMLDFGTTYQDALDKLEALIDFFSEKNGSQMELATRDGDIILCTLNKGFLGKHLDVAETSLSKSDVKSLKTGLKISKKLHPDL